MHFLIFLYVSVSLDHGRRKMYTVSFGMALISALSKLSKTKRILEPWF